MAEKKFNFSAIIMGFSCPEEMERQIIEEGKRLYDSKSGVVRRALLFYFKNKKTWEVQNEL